MEQIILTIIKIITLVLPTSSQIQFNLLNYHLLKVIQKFLWNVFRLRLPAVKQVSDCTEEHQCNCRQRNNKKRPSLP